MTNLKFKSTIWHLNTSMSGPPSRTHQKQWKSWGNRLKTKEKNSKNKRYLKTKRDFYYGALKQKNQRRRNKFLYRKLRSKLLTDFLKMPKWGKYKKIKFTNSTLTVMKTMLSIKIYWGTTSRQKRCKCWRTWYWVANERQLKQSVIYSNKTLHTKTLFRSEALRLKVDHLHKVWSYKEMKASNWFSSNQTKLKKDPMKTQYLKCHVSKYWTPSKTNKSSKYWCNSVKTFHLKNKNDTIRRSSKCYKNHSRTWTNVKFSALLAWK